MSVHDVARRAGVSLGTVSNALNRPQVVSPDTLERVRKTIDELGYVRNESARQLRAGRSRTIGLVVLDVGNPFFIDVARGVEDAANAAGLAVILCNSDASTAKEDNYLDLLEQLRVRGVLITPVDTVGPRLEAVRQRGTPVVLLDRHARNKNQSSVWVDDVLGGELAVDHLLETGHKRIAFVGGAAKVKQVEDRLKGAQRAIRRSGKVDIEFGVHVAPSLNTVGGIAAARQLLAMRPRPTAVFCVNDLIALGVLQVALEMGLRIPHDVAIVGYDDIEYAAAVSHPLSSVRQPRRLIGQTAAKLLMDEAEAGEDHRHQQIVFKPELIIRQSTDMRGKTPRA
ncbi:substrate-binding domain-containing protein [Rhizobacter sp. Root1221]|uniref:substrate-binding domain-containing protein n=1 Tax=Rhizobacter sp. Root1221 TaxID=1736433 RepID=UPI0019112411|nr:substrate-binding domain-containing protein [Rhizobacter sp. Root1221]